MLRAAGFALVFAAASVGCASSGSFGSPSSSDAKSSIKSVGDLLAAGGKKLSAAEVKPLATGSTLAGQAAGSRNQFESVLAVDGSMKGQVRTGRGPVDVEGTWTVNDQGQLCTAYTKPRVGSDCAFVYSANGTHYTALRDDPTADVLERRFTK